MALYAFDGTGNEDRDGDGFESNVAEFFEAYEDKDKNDDPNHDTGSLYLRGIGTRGRTLLGNTVAEAFGISGHKRVRQAMDRLENNVERGDQTIDVIGFSRGAALALSFANEVAKKIPALGVRFLGLWDLVGQFGAPGLNINAGHDLNFPPNTVRCYHAMALDESRPAFLLTRLARSNVPNSRLVEVWFRGTQADVGGGNENKGLNWISLNWMFVNAIRDGLPINQAIVKRNRANETLSQQVGAHKMDLGAPRVILPADLVHASVNLEPGFPDRPYNNPQVPVARIDDAGVVTNP
jgi:uncharacterized protein (DUF2235 family)